MYTQRNTLSKFTFQNVRCGNDLSTYFFPFLFCPRHWSPAMRHIFQVKMNFKSFDDSFNCWLWQCLFISKFFFKGFIGGFVRFYFEVIFSNENSHFTGNQCDNFLELKCAYHLPCVTIKTCTRLRNLSHNHDHMQSGDRMWSEWIHKQKLWYLHQHSQTTHRQTTCSQNCPGECTVCQQDAFLKNVFFSFVLKNLSFVWGTFYILKLAFFRSLLCGKNILETTKKLLSTNRTLNSPHNELWKKAYFKQNRRPHFVRKKRFLKKQRYLKWKTNFLFWGQTLYTRKNPLKSTTFILNSIKQTTSLNTALNVYTSGLR